MYGDIMAVGGRSGVEPARCARQRPADDGLRLRDIPFQTPPTKRRTQDG